MGADGLKTLITGLVLFVLFSWLILNVAVDFGAEYGRDASEIGDGSLNIAEFQSSADSVEGSAQGYRARFESGDVDDIDDASGIFSIITDMYSMITAPFRLIAQILNNIFGVPVIFTNIVLGLLAITLIFASWRMLRIGD